MTVPWPDEAPELWNTCELGGIELPGIAKVDVHPSQEVDVKKPKGRHGATVTRHGYNPAKVKIRVRCTDAAQFADLQVVIANVWPASLARKKNAQPAQVDGPIPISHPKAQLWGITGVTILSIDDTSGERGDIYELTFDCLEYYPPPKVTATKTDTKTLPTYNNAIRAPDKPSATGNTPT